MSVIIRIKKAEKIFNFRLCVANSAFVELLATYLATGGVTKSKSVQLNERMEPETHDGLLQGTLIFIVTTVEL